MQRGVPASIPAKKGKKGNGELLQCEGITDDDDDDGMRDSPFDAGMRCNPPPPPSLPNGLLGSPGRRTAALLMQSLRSDPAAGEETVTGRRSRASTEPRVGCRGKYGKILSFKKKNYAKLEK